MTSNASGLGEFTVKYNGSTDAPTNAGTYKVTVDVEEGDNYNAASGIELGSFTIAKADATASVSMEGWEYGDTAKTPVPVSTTNGTDAVTYQYKVKGADDNTYTSTVPTAIGSYTVMATFAATQNHKEVTATADFEITKRKVTVTADNASKTYGGTDPELTWTVTSGTELASEPLSVNISRAEGENADEYTITFSQNDGANPNYDITFVDGTFTINKAALTVTAENKTATYGDAVPAYTVTYSGFVSDENENNLNGTLAFNCGYAQFDDKDTYTITPSGLTSGNYDITFVPGTLTVGAKEITVTIEAKTSVYGDEIVELTADDHGGIVNNDTNVYSLATTASKTADTGKYDITGTALDGNYSITFANEEDAYEITARELTVSVEVADKKYDGLNTATITSAVLNNVVNEDVVALVNGTATFTSVDAANGISIAFTDFTLSGEAEVLKNYTLTQPTGIQASITNDWTPVEYTVSAPNGNGWLNSDFVITAESGYKVSLTNTADGAWVDSFTYSEETDNGSVPFYLKNEADGTISLAVTESYKLDKTVPTGTVSIDDNEWRDLWNTLTFGLFFKETKTVKVVPEDTLSGIAKVEYYDSAELLSTENVEAITAWTDMGEDYAQDVTAEDAKTFIYYIRITDKAGNVTYISTADATYDLTAPAISGITDGSTYYTTQKVTVTDTNLETVTLNGEAASGEITLAGDVEKSYKIVATDKAGNVTEFTVTMKPIASISAPIDSIDESNVNSGDSAVIAEVEAAAAAVDTANATEEEKAAIKAITDKCDALQEVIADTAAEYERITDAIASYDPEEVTSDDKAELDKLAEDLKALVESGNLTDSEKTALETPAETLNGMIETVTEVAAEADRIADAVGDYALETVKSSDKDEIEQLIKDIDALLATDNLTDEERTALTGEKTKCENLLAKIEGTDALVNKLTEDVGAYDEDTVKSTDKAALEQLLEDIEAVIEDNTNITEEEKAEQEALADTVEDLLAKIEEVAQAPVTEDTEKVKDITNENVTPEDKEDLEKAKADLEDALTENAGNYTEDDKKAIQEEIDRIDDALKAIENVEAVEDAVSKLPAIDTVEPDDEDAIKAITDAKAEYDALTDHEKSLVDEDTKKKLDDLCAALVAYDIIKGENGKYTQGGSKGLSFTANGAYSKFSGILVDNKVVDPKHYTAESGSTVITLKASYLDTLSVGSHTLTVVYTDGETSCEFSVLAKSATPATGDNSHIMLWVSLMIVSCAAILILLSYKRFFSHGGKYSK